MMVTSEVRHRRQLVRDGELICGHREQQRQRDTKPVGEVLGREAEDYKVERAQRAGGQEDVPHVELRPPAHGVTELNDIIHLARRGLGHRRLARGMTRAQEGEHVDAAEVALDKDDVFAVGVTRLRVLRRGECHSGRPTLAFHCGRCTAGHRARDLERTDEGLKREGAHVEPLPEAAHSFKQDHSTAIGHQPPCGLFERGIIRVQEGEWLLQLLEYKSAAFAGANPDGEMHRRIEGALRD
eukprot:scaffold26116_cov74-Phaeocystis_antarctica.AAC.5